jgi:glycosyltransferase involved in cell wall biosynthesis
MDSNVKVTIGIPIYNAEKFLSFAIASVLNQTYSNFELILSDDGSTDSSLKIAKSFNDPRIKIIHDNKNQGISYRLNEQIAIANGKYFMRMDADDIMFPDRLEKQIMVLQANNTIDVVGSYAVVIDNNNDILGLRKTAIPVNLKSCFRSVPFIHPSVMGKTVWFKKFQYSNEVKGVEDKDLWIRSFKQSNFHVIEEPLMFYRDPLNIKFATYKFRTLQLQKLYKANFDLLDNSNFFIHYLILLDYLKLILFRIFSLFKIDGFLIKNRNIKIDNDLYIKEFSLTQILK